MIFCATRVINFIGLLALAASLPLSERNELDVWSPHITFPTPGRDACIGGMLDVQWDTLDPPPSITNPLADLYLVQNGYLDMEHPLATNFPLSVGHVKVQISVYTPPGVYQVALVGDSGNLSPTFNIGYCP